MHYLNDIIAADVASAVFLSTYMRHSVRTRYYVQFLEVADLQRYKMIRKVAKVRTAIISRCELPFVFVLGKN